MTTFRKVAIGFAAALPVALAVGWASMARADEAATKILKSMSDYVAGQKSISAGFDSDIEVVTPEMQKIQFTSTGQLQLKRPDKLKITRTGGYADVEMIFDGK